MAAVHQNLDGVPAVQNGDPILALRVLIQKTVYLEMDLQTELDKINRLLDRWDLYRKEETAPEDRRSHASYVQWCGADPDDDDALQDLHRERKIVELQMQQSAAIREALVETAPDWWGHKPLDWDDKLLLTPEEQLRTKIKSLKQNRKKLSVITSHYFQAAQQHIYKQEYLQKAWYFYHLYEKELEKEQTARKELKRVRKSRNRSYEIER